MIAAMASQEAARCSRILLQEKGALALRCMPWLPQWEGDPTAVEFTTLQTHYAFELHLRMVTTGWRLHISFHPRLTSEPARETLSAATPSFVADGKTTTLGYGMAIMSSMAPRRT